MRDHPREPEFQVALAEDYQDWALIRGSTGRMEEGILALEKAAGMLRPLIRAHPDVAHYRHSLAAVLLNWGNAFSSVGKPRNALIRVGEAVELCEDELRVEPRDNLVRGHTRNAHGVRAQVLQTLGRHADAVKDWDRVIELGTRENRLLDRVFRAKALARGGEHARAAAEAEDLVKGPRFHEDAPYNCVQVYALAYKAALADTRLSRLERERAAEHYASLAITLLKRLMGEGYFRQPDWADQWPQDPEIEALRGRQDFEKLVLETKPKKSKR